MSDRYNIMELIYIREKGNRSCIYYKKARYFCIL
jgi:hypothetical protein